MEVCFRVNAIYQLIATPPPPRSRTRNLSLGTCFFYYFINYVIALKLNKNLQPTNWKMGSLAIDLQP